MQLAASGLAEGSKQQVTITVPPAFHKTLGVRMRMGQITAVREDSAAAKSGVVARSVDGSTEGDIIEAVEVTEPGGTVTRWEKGKNLDPVRLPFQLKQWAERLWKARGDNPSTAETTENLALLKLREGHRDEALRLLREASHRSYASKLFL